MSKQPLRAAIENEARALTGSVDAMADLLLGGSIDTDATHFMLAWVPVE